MAVIPGVTGPPLDSPLAKWVEGDWDVQRPGAPEGQGQAQETFLARFLHLLAAVDKEHQIHNETQTGRPKIPGMTWLPKPPKEKSPLSNGTILERIRLTYPILRASRVDTALRQLILSELLTQVYKEGGSVVIPTGMRLQPVGES